MNAGNDSPTSRNFAELQSEASALSLRVDALAGAVLRLAGGLAQNSVLCESDSRDDIGELLTLARMTHEGSTELRWMVDELSVAVRA